MIYVLFMFFQTVKYFNNEGFEAEKYDEYLKSKSFNFLKIFWLNI